jgi:hypothetical protein
MLTGGGGGMRGMHVNMNAMNGEYYDTDDDGDGVDDDGDDTDDHDDDSDDGDSDDDDGNDGMID